MNVLINKQQELLNLLVVEGDGPSLLGRDWLKQVKLDWSLIHQIHSSSEIEKILERYAVLFQDELGCVEGIRTRIVVDPDAPPKFYRPRSVPFAIRAKIKKDLERLEGQGVIESVRFAEWAAPIVPIVKGDGSVRICGDYKVTANISARVGTYPE